MAEFCWECYKKYLDPNAKRENFVISRDDDVDFCEGCGEFKPTVIAMRGQFPYTEARRLWLARLFSK